MRLKVGSLHAFSSRARGKLEHTVKNSLIKPGLEYNPRAQGPELGGKA